MAAVPPGVEGPALNLYEPIAEEVAALHGARCTAL